MVFVQDGLLVLPEVGALISDAMSDDNELLGCHDSISLVVMRRKRGLG